MLFNQEFKMLIKALSKALKKNKVKIRGQNNVFDPQLIKDKNIKLKIYGNDNKIEIAPNATIAKLTILIYGNNNVIRIGSKTAINDKSAITIGQYFLSVDDCAINIGERCALGSFFMILGEKATAFNMGNDCLVADGVEFWGTDGHSMLNDKKEITNFAQGITIGNHVWIAKDVKIGKNVQLAENSVVSFGSIVTGKFPQPGSLIGGNPATVYKTNINWNRETPVKK